MLEQQLGSPSCGSSRAPLTRVAVVLGQAPDRSQRFVKRRVMRIWIGVAVPTAVRPLRAQQHLDKPSDAEAVRHAEVTADGKRVAFHRGVTAFLARHDHRLRRRRDPVEHSVGGCSGGTASTRNAELRERDEPPVRAGPLGVGMDAERAVSPLAFQKPCDHPLAPGLIYGSGDYSHSIVPGGFDVMSNTTRFTPLTSLTMRLLIRASTSYGTRAQSAVIASSLVTTRTATTLAYVRKSPITP